jgi:hypothetical protein
MKDRHLPLFSTLLLAIFLSGAAAQVPDFQNRPTTPNVATFGFVPHGFDIFAKQHAPFTATAVERMEQTLSDGTTISRESHETLMRDGLGRTYIAREVEGPGRSEKEAGLRITLTDPVERVRYLCTPLRTCIKSKYQAPLHKRPHLVTDEKQGITVEDLGPSTISGIAVEGKRITRVFAEGTIGNDRPIAAIQEIWHSKALDLDVQATYVDPRTGTRKILVSDFSLEEPDPSYFQIPDGYKVRELVGPTGTLAPGKPASEP